MYAVVNVNTQAPDLKYCKSQCTIKF